MSSQHLDQPFRLGLQSHDSYSLKLKQKVDDTISFISSGRKRLKMVSDYLSLNKNCKGRVSKKPKKKGGTS